MHNLQFLQKNKQELKIKQNGSLNPFANIRRFLVFASYKKMAIYSNGLLRNTQILRFFDSW